MSLPNKYIGDETSVRASRTLPPSPGRRPQEFARSAEGAVRWFPLRIYHSSASRQAGLDGLLSAEPSVERTYVPRRLVDAEAMTYAPALVNYVFVRTTLESLRRLKSEARYVHLRYVMDPGRDGGPSAPSGIAHVPDKQMSDFMRAVSDANEHVLFLENMEFACRPGQRVRIRKGPFEGVEGVVKSIRKHLCVVIAIRNVMAVAITNVPKKHLESIGDGQ